MAHEVINAGSDKAQLCAMATAVRDAMGAKKLRAIVDRGLIHHSDTVEAQLKLK